MRSSTFVTLALAGLLSAVECAEYIFPHLVLLDSGVETAAFKFVRDVAVEPGLGFAENDILGKARPIQDINSEAMACGRQAFLSAAKTQTTRVKPGANLGFHVWHDNDDLGNGLDKIIWSGPAQIYLARAPHELETFNGTEGNWFKIASITTYYNKQEKYWDWKAYNQKQVNFTIPKATPDGAYLLRIEHFSPTRPQPLFFVNCAHIRIERDGPTNYPVGEIPDDAYAKFPGTYKLDDPRIDPDKGYIYEHLPDYIGPGPAVWTGDDDDKTPKAAREFKA